ncbi:MAG: sodium/glutamate symporter, partial [Gammaproteobacteria bacterium]|nr:sodium/glutamate symporter [Gammaproteobacteria bacterium]
MTITLDMVQTLAAGALALFVGFQLVDRVPFLRRYNIPAPVVGGLIVAILVLVLRQQNVATISFDTTLQTPLMNAFFTAIGFSASLSLLRAGSGQALVFLVLAAFLAVVQSLIGIFSAVLFDQSPLLGVLIGPAALAGGPATALAFAPQFAAAGVPSAETVAIAAAMSGIVLGGLVGGPIATRLLERHALRAGSAAGVEQPGKQSNVASESATTLPEDEEGSARQSLKALTVILVAMGIGSWLSGVMKDAGLTLPGYVGAMIVGAMIRNVDDFSDRIGIPHDITDRIGTVSLTLFLAVALMNVKLWELTAVAWPLLVNLALQVVVIALFCWAVVFRAMGRDYDAAVMSGGFTGFMLGTTANAMAVMRTIVEKFGP